MADKKYGSVSAEAKKLYEAISEEKSEAVPVEKYKSSLDDLRELIHAGIVQHNGARGKAATWVKPLAPLDEVKIRRKYDKDSKASGTRVKNAGPSLEEARDMVAYIFQAEKKLKASLEQRLRAEAADLKKQLLAADDEAEEQRLLDDLQTKRAEIKDLSATLRTSAIREGAKAEEPWAKYVHLLSNRVG